MASSPLAHSLSGFCWSTLFSGSYLNPRELDWHAIATLATWFMTLVIQRAEHRDTQAIHAKLDEILHALGDARNEITRMDEKEPESVGESKCARTIFRSLDVPHRNWRLKRIARYSHITNEALVVEYRERNRLIVDLSYSGVPRHSERHQIEFCMFAALRICRMLTGQNLVPQHFSISHYRSEGISEMTRFVGTKVELGADTNEFALNIDARALPLIHSDPYLNASSLLRFIG